MHQRKSDHDTWEDVMPFSLAALVRGIFTMVFVMIASAASAATYMYVGNAGSSEIVVLSLDPKTGDLKEIEKVVPPGLTKAGGSIPMGVSANKKFLYAGFRGEPLAVAAFGIDAKSGKLKHLGNGPLNGSMPYIAADRTGKFLISASYPQHRATVNTIGADGVVGAVKQSVEDIPNAHAVLFDKSNKHVLVPSLGSDTVRQFNFDPATGALTANGAFKAAEKSGPRHIRLSNNEKFAYLLTELFASIYVLPYDAKTGTLGKVVQVVNAMPPNSQKKPWAAEIQLTPNGKFLYASERTTSTLSVFKVDGASGMLTQVEVVPTEAQPRMFQIDPTGKYLYAVGEKSDSMTSYAIDQASGKLTKLKQYPVGKTPNWIEILTLP
jgi:6-phosphogluconolactonase